jgi:hypothetical protein
MKGKYMNTLSPESKAASKVIVKACCVVDQRRAVQAAPQGQKARQAGRLNQSVAELAEAVEMYRKVGAKP